MFGLLPPNYMPPPLHKMKFPHSLINPNQHCHCRIGKVKMKQPATANPFVDEPPTGAGVIVGLILVVWVLCAWIMKYAMTN